MNEEKSRKYERVVIKCKDKGGPKEWTDERWAHRYKKSLLGLIAGIMLATPALAKYECTGTGQIVGQRYLTQRIFQTDEDTNGDLKPDVQSLYIFDNGCTRKLRENKYGAETKEESRINNLGALADYLDGKSK